MKYMFCRYGKLPFDCKVFFSRACGHIAFLQPLFVIIIEDALKSTLWGRQETLPISFVPGTNAGQWLDLFVIFNEIPT